MGCHQLCVVCAKDAGSLFSLSGPEALCDLPGLQGLELVNVQN